MKLAAFAKTFGFTERQKGYSPHFFNRAENQDYAGPLPHWQYYDPDETFLAWLNDLANKEYVFDFSAEIFHYCQARCGHSSSMLP